MSLLYTEEQKSYSIAVFRKSPKEKKMNILPPALSLWNDVSSSIYINQYQKYIMASKEKQKNGRNNHSEELTVTVPEL